MRTENDDLLVYRPYVDAGAKDKENSNLRFFRETNHFLPDVPSNLDTDSSNSRSQRARPLRILPNVSGFSTVFMPGTSASFVFKTSTSVPHIIRLRGGYVRGLSGFDSSAIGCAEGFVFVDSMVCSSPNFLGFFELMLFSGRNSDMSIASGHAI